MIRNQHKFLRAIATGMFCIHPAAVATYLPKIVGYINGDFAENTAEKPTELSIEAEMFLNQFKAFRADATPFGVSERETWYYDNFPVQIGEVVVIPVLDAITQEDYCYTAGTKTIMGWYQKAENDPSVTGIIEIMNSPGGEMFGTRALADYKSTMQKPIVGICEGLQCSAGEYIAAPNNYQFAISEECLIGSIGVMTSFQNWSKFYAKNGVEIRDLYSKGSPLKNDEHRRAMNGDFKGYENEMLFEFDESFMGFIKKHRTNVSKTALQGKAFTTNKAIEAGLIDEIGSFQDAYNKVLALAEGGQAPTTKQKTSTSMKKVQMLIPSALVGSIKLLGGELVEETDTNDAAETNDETEHEDDTEEAGEVAAVEATSENAEIKALQTQLANLQQRGAQQDARIAALSKATPAAATRSVARVAAVETVPEVTTEVEAIITATSVTNSQRVKNVAQRGVSK